MTRHDVSEYAALAVHSDYSLMQGVDSVEALCTAAVKRGVRYLALTDINNFYIAVRFWQVAREAGLVPILGADIQVEGDVKNASERAILLAESSRGYRRICRIISDYHLCRGVPGGPGGGRTGHWAATKKRGAGRNWPGGGRRVGRITLPDSFSLKQALLEDRRGIRLLVPVGNSAGGAGDAGLQLAEAIRKETGPEKMAMMIAPGRSHRREVEWARKAAVDVVATPDVFFVDPEGLSQHRLLRAIHKNTKLSRLVDRDCVAKNSWLMPANRLERHLPDLPGALRAATETATACAMKSPPWGPVIFPRFRAGDNGESGGGARDLSPSESYELLKKMAYEGAVRRYGAMTRPVQERLDRELTIIKAKGFAEYFLVVAEIVTRAPRTCGRGSAAASLVSYALGITHVDAVRYDLYFERFLNMGREDPPDIDVDFPWDERDDVLEDVFSRYGEDRAAMVANHLCFRGRASVREVAKVYGLSQDEIGKVTRRLGLTWATGPAREMIDAHPLFKDITLDRPWPEILDRAAKLEGHPRHLSVHCGGVVIVPGAIWDHVPIQPAAKGVNVIQWEKDQAEDAGLVKIDLLGNRSLAVIRDALAAVEAGNGVVIPYDRFNPLQDLRTKEMIRTGDTVGVFYVESPAMRQLQQKTATGEFERLVIHSSIIRPAANKYIREYVRRLRGGSYKSIHPLVDEILPDSFGIMVYQEDVAKVVIAMAGFDAASADNLRKVLSKKHKAKKLAEYRKQFESCAAARGFTLEVVEAVWQMILSFGGYSFCKPHSASYALVSFKSAYLRAHYPAEFMAAVISNRGGYYATFAYISECRRMGLQILPPDVNDSAIAYTGGDGRVRVGLMQVQGMKSASREEIVDRRRDGPYRSFEDFLARTGIDPADVRLLIKAGAFDAIAGGRTRPELMWRWTSWSARRPVPGKGRGRKAEPRPSAGLLFPLFPDDECGGGSLVPGGIGDYDPKKVLSDEIETLGFLISRHPLTLYREEIRRLRRVVAAKDLGTQVGREVVTVGWLVTGKVVQTRDGEPMEFVSFEDTTALYETTFFPEIYKRFCHMLSYTRPYALRGKVEEDMGAVTLTVSGLKFLA
jgi:error-prone DNA polymerase